MRDRIETWVAIIIGILIIVFLYVYHTYIIDSLWFHIITFIIGVPLMLFLIIFIPVYIIKAIIYYLTKKNNFDQ